MDQHLDTHPDTHLDTRVDLCSHMSTTHHHAGILPFLTSDLIPLSPSPWSIGSISRGKVNSIHWYSLLLVCFSLNPRSVGVQESQWSVAIFIFLAQTLSNPSSPHRPNLPCRPPPLPPPAHEAQLTNQSSPGGHTKTNCFLFRLRGLASHLTRQLCVCACVPKWVYAGSAHISHGE